MTRTCAKCKKTKDLNGFYKNKGEPLGYSYTCQPCALEYNKIWRSENKKRSAKIVQDWKDRNPEKVYTGKLRREYNISFEEFQIILKNQNSMCSICLIKIEKPYIAKKLNIESVYVDHCHKTNKIRGLLCQHCNTGIGFFRDNIEIMKNAINYLKQSSNDGKES